MFYTEITKIIEAGIKKDPTKVASYSRLLAKKLSSDGEERASSRILSVLDKIISAGSFIVPLKVINNLPLRSYITIIQCTSNKKNFVK